MAKKTRKQQNGRRKGANRSSGVRQDFRGTSAQPHAIDNHHGAAAERELVRVARTTGASIAGASQSMLGSIKRHPVSATLMGLGATCIGLGATYLWMNTRASQAIGYRQPSIEGGEPQLLEPSLADTARESLSRLGNGTGQLARRAQSSLGGAAHVAGTKVTQLMHDAGVQSRRLGTAVEQAFIAHPLAVGAATLAVGTAIGLALPSTIREGRWFGQSRDAVVGRAQELARQTIDSVGSMAKQALGEAPARASA